jgi:hypothetical protein
VGHQYAQAGSEGRRLVAFGDAAGIQGALGVDAVGAVRFSVRWRVGIMMPRWTLGSCAVGRGELVGE